MGDAFSSIVDNALDRFRKLRLGQLKSDIDVDGYVIVDWLDGDFGKQVKVQISFPAFNNTDSTPWGIEAGYGKGTVAVFGFLTDNHAVLLTNVIPKTKIDKTGKKIGGFERTKKIRTGELRLSSRALGSIYFDLQGNVIIANPKNSITLDNSGQMIFITSPGVTIQIGTIDANGQPLDSSDTTPNKSTVSIQVDGDIELTAAGSKLAINDKGVQIETTSSNPVSIGGKNHVLYSITGNNPQQFEDIAVSDTLTVGGPTQAVDISTG